MVRRLKLITRGLFTRRRRPDLASLRAEEDPERFVWAVLPHAARSFAASIVVLPPRTATAAAVGYLYARILDTYEDLLADEAVRPAALRSFAGRFAATPPTPVARISDARAADDRDRLHLLLVEKVGHIDTVFGRLDERHRSAIVAMISSMAEGMAWSSERFIEQGGVLIDDEQLMQYCHNVIGYPALFAIELLTGAPPASEADAFAASEMIQLANVTRDIEKDLARGIAYDPALRPLLGRSSGAEIIPVRARLTTMALSRAASYRALYETVDVSRRPGARLAAVLMLLFTDLHYRRMTTMVGRTPWPGPGGKFTTVLRALPAALSSRYAAAVISSVERRFLTAAGR